MTSVRVSPVVSHVATWARWSGHVLAGGRRWCVLLMVRIVAVLAVALRMGTVAGWEIVGARGTGMWIARVSGVWRWHARVGLHVRRHVVTGRRRRMSLLLGLLVMLGWDGYVRRWTVGVGTTVGWSRLRIARGGNWSRGRSCD